MVLSPGMVLCFTSQALNVPNKAVQTDAMAASIKTLQAVVDNPGNSDSLNRFRDRLLEDDGHSNGTTEGLF